MRVQPIQSGREVLECVRMYMAANDEGFMETSLSASFDALYKAVQSGKFVRKATDDGEIVGWLYAELVRPPYSKYKVLQQNFYACSAHGARAYRCAAALHSAMEEEGRRVGARYLLSQGSHFDPENVYARILERLGWERRHYLCVKRL